MPCPPGRWGGKADRPSLPGPHTAGTEEIGCAYGAQRSCRGRLNPLLASPRVSGVRGRAIPGWSCWRGVTKPSRHSCISSGECCPVLYNSAVLYATNSAKIAQSTSQICEDADMTRPSHPTAVDDYKVFRDASSGGVRQ
ncbi:hypothetical protein E2C01_009178 [Portunus trituberculatus]|uniref:Uncharacterized protein n=1 Tax=Portunus trituberculatus TaxID=210409 RepID=A0A5B7D4R4_PORTR|nr:hypothetical protein [Portunus trituberculatus]